MKPKIYYYHTIEIGRTYAGWKVGDVPGHWLYGATHLSDLGWDVLYHEPKWHHQRWKLSLHTAYTIIRRRKDFDILYATTFRGLEIVVFLHALGIFRKPVAVWHHQPVTRAKNLFREWAARLFYRGLDGMFFFSNKIIADSLHSIKAKPSKMHIAHWGADLDFYDKILATDGNIRRTGFISTGKEKRDMPTLVQAFNETKKTLDIYICSSYGGINYRSLFSSLSLKSNIQLHWAENMVPVELCRQVNAASCVVICCEETNYTVGLTTLVEAWGLGIPVICSRNPQMPVDIDKEGCGITVPYGNVEAWKKAIEYICTHQEEALEMGRKGRSLAEKLYNLRQCAQDVSVVLKSLLAERQH